MPDPKKFKSYYIIEAFSSKKNKIMEQHIATEMGRMVKCSDLQTARNRCKTYAESLNEVKKLGVDDWAPMIHLQYSESQKILVPTE